jgi:hypothetical protein
MGYDPSPQPIALGKMAVNESFGFILFNVCKIVCAMACRFAFLSSKARYLTFAL